MKLVAFFVPGDVQAAIDVVNELHLTYEFAQMMAATRPKVPVYPGDNPFDPKFLPRIHGYNVFVRLSDQRVNWLHNNLERLKL